MIIKKTTGGAISLGGTVYANPTNVEVYALNGNIMIIIDHKLAVGIPINDVELEETPATDLEELIAQIADLFVSSGGSTPQPPDPEAGTTPITFNDPAMSNTDGVWTRVVSGGPAHFKASNRLEAGEVDRIIMDVQPDAIVKFLVSTDSNPVSANSDWALELSPFQGSQRILWGSRNDGGVVQSTSAPYVALFRAADGTITLQETYNKTVFNDVYTYSVKNTGILYIGIYSENDSTKIYNPKVQVIS